MPSINNSTVEVELDIDLDSEEFKSLLYLKYGSCNYAKFYRGSQEQLTNAGVPLPLFPGQPGRRKTITIFTIKGGEARLTRLQGKTVKYILAWYIPEHLRPIEDPGYESALKASLASPARFNVGDVCIYWAPGHDFHGEKLEITKAYQFMRANTPTGRFIDTDGKRFDYVWGYVAREIGGEPCFFSAHELRDIDHNIRHIRLVGAVETDTHEHGQAAG